jgi:SAM-dependent methyltransferase
VNSYAVGLDNASQHGAAHLDGLAGMFDHFTQARIAESVVLAGARCLELGAGNGSIAVWLADQVGPDGEVIATDIDPEHIPEHERLTVLRHDLLADPLPAGPFNLIHARCLLSHLSGRDAITARLCRLLVPGGVILIEGFDVVGSRRTTSVLFAPPDLSDAVELWDRYEQLRDDLFATAGTDGSFMRRVHGLLGREGLTQLRSVSYATSWCGGSPGSRHAAATLQQSRAKLADRGFTGTMVDRLAEALADRRLHIAGRTLWSTSGVAPGH